MRSARRLLAVVGTIITFAAVAAAPSVSATPTLQPLHVTKDCSSFTGSIPSYCTVTASNLGAIPVGTKIFYYGPVLGPNFLSSVAVIRAGRGNRAVGYCSAIYSPYHGVCTFWKGTGTLEGFNASVDVSADSTGIHWDGTYLFAPSD